MAKAQKSVVLTGMMGAGKSAAGRLLADALGLPFRDSDREIEKTSGKDVSAIIAAGGEAAFRRLEEAAMAKLLGGEPAVIAAGGGAVESADTRRLLRRRAVTVWLGGDAEVLFERAMRTGRPLLAGPEPERRFRELLEARAPLYRKADLKVDTTHLTPREVAEAVLERLGSAL